MPWICSAAVAGCVNILSPPQDWSHNQTLTRAHIQRIARHLYTMHRMQPRSGALGDARLGQNNNNNKNIHRIHVYSSPRARPHTRLAGSTTPRLA